MCRRDPFATVSLPRTQTLRHPACVALLHTLKCLKQHFATSMGFAVVVAGYIRCWLCVDRVVEIGRCLCGRVACWTRKYNYFENSSGRLGGPSPSTSGFWQQSLNLRHFFIHDELRVKL